MLRGALPLPFWPSFRLDLLEAGVEEVEPQEPPQQLLLFEEEDVLDSDDISLLRELLKIATANKKSSSRCGAAE